MKRWIEKYSRRLRIAGFLCLFVIVPAAGMGLLLLPQDDYTEEPINYLKTPPTDAIADLQRKLDAGEAQLTYDDRHGYLLSVLQQLHVPISSQMLVFSKTSFQRERISPETPRALYFNDRVYIGWVQGGDYVEVASVDPKLGAVFYVLPQRKTDAPKFVRQTYECLQCHDTNMAGSVPGHIMRSVYPNREGQPILTAGTYLSTDRSPLQERWGGWYVTGRHGTQRHMGNVVAKSELAPEQTDWGAGANVTDLRKFIDTAPYLSSHSDIVALLVAEHQTQIQNQITRAGFETRRAVRYEQLLNRDLGRAADYHSDSTVSRIKSVCEPLVKAMLFSGETQLTSPISGASGFTERFASYGPRDHQGRSLREFDLKRRLFRYPCSYQIYSAAFDSLPEQARSYIYGRLVDILTGKDHGPDFAHLTDEDRHAIREILRDTKPEYAAWETRAGNSVPDRPAR
jgi:hypothetical protein